MSETTAKVLAYVVLCLLTFQAAREVWSAWKAGSIKSKIGLVFRKTNARAFQSMARLMAFALFLFAFSTFAAAFVLANRIFVGRDWPGVVFGLLTLSVIMLLGAKYSRKPDSANRTK